MVGEEGRGMILRAIAIDKRLLDEIVRGLEG